MKKLTRLLSSIIVLLYSGYANGIETDTPRQFNIELLIFQNLIENDGGEVWPVDYSTWFDNVSEEATSSAAAPLSVTWLSQENFNLTAERNALGRSSRYRPLAYLAWRQPVYDRSRAQPMTLPAPGNTRNGYVDGTVKVAVERYLHLYLDLQLHLPAATMQVETGQTSELPEIRLTEKRRMRSQELHYFDNPRFGVIALITPHETAESPPGPEQDTAPPTQP
jgi:hypothetical protein